MRITFPSKSTALAVLATVLSACPAAQPADPPVLPPVITSFKADMTEVTAGAAVKLTFTAERAKEVTLLDQTGATVTLSGDVNGGDATVNPTETSFYVLRVSGEGGRDSAFVQVAVGEGLRQVFLVVVPTEIDSGDSVTVAWSALGGTNITLKDASGNTISTDPSGSKDLPQLRSNQFDLKATGLLGPLSASASVKVRPVIQTFTVSPPAAKQDEKLTFAWKTSGADTLKLTEATFGEIVNITSQGAVDEGSYDFTVPRFFDADAGTPADGGAGPREVPENFPLRFTLAAETAMPPQSVHKELPSFVRDGPSIFTFDSPAFVTETKPAKLTWTVLNAHRTEILLDGAPVFSTVPPASANGTFTIPALTADVNVTLVAYDFNGLSVSESRTMKVVKAPKVNTFTLPAAVASGGTAAAAMWTTMNTSLLIIRVKNGPAEFQTRVAAMLGAGMTALRPARTTTYVLEAYNDAGDKDTLEKTINVTTPVIATATANPTAPNTLVQLTWDVTPSNPSDIIGIPAEPPAQVQPSTGFFDLVPDPGAKKLLFADNNDSNASFSVGFGFTFPVAGVPVSTFSASTNGFVAIGTVSTSTAANVDLKGATALPAFQMLAPFWDDLFLGTDGTVHWMLEGQSFPRRLIIQWSGVHIAGDPDSRLTFQVQLFETGEFRYEYKQMLAQGAMGQGESASVGVFLGTTIFAGQFSFNAPLISDNLQLTWFTNGAAAGTRFVPVGTANINPGFFYKTTQNNYVWVSVPVRVFSINSLMVNEVMPTPMATVTEGQYIELFNATANDTDLGGIEVSTGSTPGSTFTIPPGTNVPKFGYVVLGQTTVAANNGDAPVDIAYGGSLTVLGADTVAIRVNNSLIADGGTSTTPYTVNSYAWGMSTAGTSVQRDVAIGGALAGGCTLTQTYGMTGSVGTPGKINESCFPYTMTQIPVAFEDVSMLPDAGPLFPVTTWDDQLVTVPLPVQFRYFGVDAGSIVVGGNGFVTTRPGETASGITNKAAPGSGTPQGVIAPFWDDLASNSVLTGLGSNAYQARQANTHHVVQWKKVAVLSDRTSSLDFEVKLFDNGVIEFHYGDLIDTPTTAGRAAGSSATAWLEAPDGGSALPISINQPNLAPNTAYRFTPKP